MYLSCKLQESYTLGKLSDYSQIGYPMPQRIAHTPRVGAARLAAPCTTEPPGRRRNTPCKKWPQVTHMSHESHLCENVGELTR